MTAATYEVDGYIRVAIDIPETALKFDPDVSADLSIPVMIVGDSSRSTAMHVGYRMLRDQGYSGRFIVDMLLVNGTCNRYLSVTVDRATEQWHCKTASDGDVVISEELHNRCTALQQKFFDKAACHVLTAAQSFAVERGIPLPHKVRA